MSTHVWIAQCLCPQRHCILAAADEAENKQAAEATVMQPLREQVTTMLQCEVLNPWCSLCNAKAESWRYEVGRSRFRSMAEATSSLRQNEAEQAATRALWGDMSRND